jgi:hypothetical protein
MRVELVIDELVLTGFDPRDKQRIADALVRELSTRVTAADAMALGEIGDAHAVLRAPDVVSAKSSRARTPNAIGAAVGRSIAASIGAPRVTHSTRVNGDV